MIVRRAKKMRKQPVTEQAPRNNQETKRSHRQSRGPARHRPITPGPRGHQCLGAVNERCGARDRIVQLNAPLRVIFGRHVQAGGEVFGSRAIPQAQPRTSETPNTSSPAGPCRGTKKRPCARWIRMPDRGSLWLLPSGPDQIRNMSSSEPIERARRSVYLTRSRPMGQDS